MTEAHKELAMENEAVALLDSKGWLYEDGSNARYDKKRALFPEDVFAWLEATQSDELAKFLHPGMDSTQEMKARDGILDALATALNQPVESGGGTLNILRKGFRRIGSRFLMAQPKPTETLNPKTVEDYQHNRLRVVQQVHKGNQAADFDTFGKGAWTFELKVNAVAALEAALLDLLGQHCGHAVPIDNVVFG